MRGGGRVVSEKCVVRNGVEWNHTKLACAAPLHAIVRRGTRASAGGSLTVCEDDLLTTRL